MRIFSKQTKKYTLGKIEREKNYGDITWLVGALQAVQVQIPDRAAGFTVYHRTKLQKYVMCIFEIDFLRNGKT